MASPASATDTEHFRPPADASQSIILSTHAHICQLQTGLESALFFWMSSDGSFQQLTSWLFDWLRGDRCCSPGRSLALQAVSSHYIKSDVCDVLSRKGESWRRSHEIHFTTKAGSSMMGNFVIGIPITPVFPRFFPEAITNISPYQCLSVTEIPKLRQLQASRKATSGLYTPWFVTDSQIPKVSSQLTVVHCTKPNLHTALVDFCLTVKVQYCVGTFKLN